MIINQEVYDVTEFVDILVDGQNLIVVNWISRKSTAYIVVKSETLRDILREVLENVKTVSIIEAKPSVSSHCLE